MEKISIIIPCLNEEESLPLYYREMQRVMKELKEVEFELIFVDDGSTDGTLAVMKELNSRDYRCRYLSFSRNFGKESAIYAGLSNAVGDYAAIMDADLQDPPQLLVDMYRILQEEPYDCVASCRSDRRGEPGFRSFLSEHFYKWMSRFSKNKMMSGARDFRLMRRQMVDAVLEMSEYNRFSKGIFEWVGFRTKWVGFENAKRAAGTTKWSLCSLFRYAIDGITEFSTAPLLLGIAAGAVFSAIALVLLVIGAAELLSGAKNGAVWFLIAGIVFLVSGVQLLCTGISGWYLSKTYLEVKHRPIYILKEESRREPVSISDGVHREAVCISNGMRREQDQEAG